MLRLIKSTKQLASLQYQAKYCIFDSNAQTDFNREDEESQKMKKLLKSF